MCASEQSRNHAHQKLERPSTPQVQRVSSKGAALEACSSDKVRAHRSAERGQQKRSAAVEEL